MTCRSARVSVLGAGVAGLTAGWHMANQGVAVQMFEQASRVGGMAVTLESDGYRFDLGPHRFYSHDPAMLDLVHGLLGDELLLHHRSSQIRYNGRYLDYPPNVPSLLRNVDVATSVQCLYDYIRATWQRRATRGDEPDFESWVVSRFGRRLYDMYFGPYTRKVWGLSPQLISAEMARRRLTAPNLTDVILRLMIPGKDSSSPYVTEFWYPRDGIGRIAERLAEEIVAGQGTIHLDSTVESVHVSGNRAVGVTVSQGDRQSYVPCDWVVSTLPLPVLIRRIVPAAGEAVRQAADALSFRGLVFVFILVDGPQLTHQHWLYFPEAQTLFNRLTEPCNFSLSHVPSGKTSLCAEITCDVGDEIWQMPPEMLASQTIQHLAGAGLLDPARVEGFFTRCTPWGYPIYRVGYEHDLDRVMEFLGGIENLVTCGRQGSFDYSDMATAMASGLAAAKSSLVSIGEGRDH